MLMACDMDAAVRESCSPGASCIRRGDGGVWESRSIRAYAPPVYLRDESQIACRNRVARDFEPLFDAWAGAVCQ